MYKNLRLLAVALTCASAASAQTVIGITETDSMFRFRASAPGMTMNKMAITGLISNHEIAGIDFRPATGELYALGYDAGNATGQLYTLDTATGAATVVGASFNVTLGGGSIGFDFNPTVDRIRLVSDIRTNYRINPTTGAVTTDGSLNYPVGDPNFPGFPSVGAAAYTNSFPLLSGTQVYYYDENTNTLATSTTPNNGTLNTVGSTGIMVNTSNTHTDLDISFNPMTRQNTAYLVANTVGSANSNLYTINLSTGATTPLGAMGRAVKDIAVAPMPFATAPAGSRIIHALAGRRSLISFPANNPRQILSLKNMTGIDSMYTVVGMDFRPATQELYALGYAGGDTSSRYRLYRIDTGTGAATMINMGMMDTLNLGRTTEVGFDFNPTVDRIRVVSGENGMNYRLNPITGAIAATDSTLRFTNGDQNDGDSVNVSTVAYTNSYPNPTATTLYGINDSGSIFVKIAPPNNGRLNTIANSIYGATANVTMPGDMDFFYDSTSMMDMGYVVANKDGFMQDVLYTIDTNGMTMEVDTIGYGFSVSDIAVMPMFRNANPSSVSVAEANAGLRVFPNPASVAFRIELLEAAQSRKSWSVTDLAGRTLVQGVLAAGERNADVTLQNLASGLYLLQVEGYSPVRFNKL